MNTQKVVLQLLETSGPGGAENVVLELCRGLDRREFVPIVGLLKDGWLARQLRSNGIETVILENRYAYDPSCLLKMVDLIRRQNVRIIHAHEFMMNVYGTVAAALTRRPLLATIHGRNYFLDKWRRKFAYRCIPLFPATRVITVSESLKEFVSTHVGIDKKRIDVVYNGVDVGKFSVEPAQIEEIIGRTGRISHPIIGTIGNLYPVKGHLYLLRAAAIVIKEFPEAVFLIVGKKTDYLETLIKESIRLDIEKNVYFLGHREDVPSFLKSIDIFVLPSLQETFSIATIEALAASKPVVATRCGGPEEIIVDGNTGFLAAPADPVDLAERIMYLIRNEGVAREISEAGRRTVSEKFTLEAMIKCYQRLYKDSIKLSEGKRW